MHNPTHAPVVKQSTTASLPLSLSLSLSVAKEQCWHSQQTLCQVNNGILKNKLPGPTSFKNSSTWFLFVTPREKLTWLAGKPTTNEDGICYEKNGDFPPIVMFLFGFFGGDRFSWGRNHHVFLAHLRSLNFARYTVWLPGCSKFVRQGTALRLPVFAACHKVPPNIDISPRLRFGAVEKTHKRRNIK